MAEAGVLPFKCGPKYAEVNVPIPPEEMQRCGRCDEPAQVLIAGGDDG